MQLRLLHVFAIACILFLAGCAGKKIPTVDVRGISGIELTKTTFYPQQKYQCGPAALAALLNSSGVNILPEQLSSKLYLPGKQGSLQLEIIAAIRSNNRVAYEIPQTLAALLAELHQQRPVLVLQNLGLKIFPAYHYAVVIGFLQPDIIVLRSGTTRRLLMDIDSFLISWNNAGSWGVVALNPDQLPANPDSNKYITALAAFETLGKPMIAEAGYRAFLREYPDTVTALFGLGNSLVAQTRLEEAYRVYSHLIRQHPNFAPAINNMAETLSQLHCHQTAVELIDTFLKRQDDAADFPDFLLSTQQEIVVRDKNDRENGYRCNNILNIPDNIRQK